MRIALGFSLEGTVQSGGILVIGVIFCFLCFSFVFFIFCDNLNHDILIRLFLVFPLFCPSECIYSVLFLYKYYDIHVQVGKTQNILVTAAFSGAHAKSLRIKHALSIAKRTHLKLLFSL